MCRSVLIGAIAAASVLAPGLPARALPPGARVEIVHSHAGFITDLAFAPDGRLFYIEKPGFSSPASARCMILDNGTIQPQPFITLTVDSRGERGLLGLAFDPGYPTNHYVYFYYTNVSPSVNRIVRYTDSNGVGETPLVIYESPPLTSATNHNSGKIHFGPDGQLYAVVGENANAAHAQDLSTPLGKMLRINPDGTAPADNPFVSDPRFPNADPRVWAWGIRNSFGFTFHPNGLLYETENGPSCDDEINLIEAGKNYGWQPGYTCYPNQPTQNTALTPPYPYTMPLPYENPTSSQYVYATSSAAPPFATVAPTGIAAYTGAQMAEYRGNLFYGWNKVGQVWRIALSADGRRALAHERFVDTTEVPAGDPALNGVTAVADGPDGALYFTDAGGTSYIRRIVRPAPSLSDVARALSIAAGLVSRDAADAPLDVYPPNSPDGRITLEDAVYKARALFHLE